MEQKKIRIFFTLLAVTIFIFSCKNENVVKSKDYSVKLKSFKKGYFDTISNIASVKYLLNADGKTFSYHCKECHPGIDVLRIDSSKNVFYNDVLLELIDKKNIVHADGIIEVRKYTDINQSGTGGLSFLYLNFDYGLILRHHLVHDDIIEFDPVRFHELQEKIINDSILFKESEEFLKMKKELEELNKSFSKNN